MKELEDFPIIYNQTVAWGDMDSLGHVNNVRYHRYMESARIEYMNRLGIIQEDSFPVVASNHCQYRRPVFFPDVLKVAVRIEEIRRSAFRMHYLLYSTEQNQLVAQGESVLVMVDKSHSKTELSLELKAKIIEFERAAGNIINSLD